jgi:steroid delta-isomerase-like uncharacterized protein
MPDIAANETVAHRWHLEIFQDGRLDVADEILAPGFAFHTPLQEGQGVEGAKQLATAYRAAFPDLRIEHVDTLAAGDKVAIRWMARATHLGDFEGIPVTGARLRLWGIDLFHLHDGKIAEAWIEWDVFGALRQMGLVSWPVQAAQPGTAAANVSARGHPPCSGPM